MSMEPRSWKPEEMYFYLASQYVEESLCRLMLNNKITGLVFLTLTKDDFMGEPFNIYDFASLESLVFMVSEIKSMDSCRSHVELINIKRPLN